MNFQAGSLITVCYSALEALGSWCCFSCYLSFKFKQGLEGNILKSRVKCSMHEGQYNCKSLGLDLRKSLLTKLSYHGSFPIVEVILKSILSITDSDLGD